MGVLYWAARNLVLVVVVLIMVALVSHIATEKWMYRQYGQLFVAHQETCRYLLRQQSTRCLEEWNEMRWRQLGGIVGSDDHQHRPI